MTNRYTGGIISATAPTVSQSSASGVWNLEEAQYYQKAGLWPDGSGADPYFRNNVLLLHGDGTNGAQNNTFLDSSTNNFTITRNGNTTQGSFDPYAGPGCWSDFYAPTSSGWQTPANSVTSILGSTFNSTATFTVEAWIYPVTRHSGGGAVLGYVFGSLNLAGSNVDWSFGPDSNGNLVTFWYQGGNQICKGGSVIPLNTWTHIALSVSAGSIKMFVNGVQETTTGPTSITLSTQALSYVSSGGYLYAGTTWQGFNGYISNLRVIGKRAAYTTNFTPSTTPLVATTDTTLLTCQQNGFTDMSGANWTLTKTGSAQISKFSPFTLYQVTPTSYSGYFDGTGDYLTAPASNSTIWPGSGSFTIEYWLYLPANPSTGYYTHFSYGTSGSVLRVFNTASTSKVEVFSGVSVILNPAWPTAGQWNHFALVRNGTTLTLYINGAVAQSVTNSTDFSTGTLTIGGESASNPLLGSISNFRIVKGTAVYTSAFTPPTSPLTAISGTSLLTCQSTTFIDNSTNAFTVTVNGNATPKRANPFTDTVTGPTPYAAAAYGGSAYFDGTGDYLSCGTSAAFGIGTGDFTIEYWVYLNSLSGTPTVFDMRSSGADIMLTDYYNGSGNPILYYNSANLLTSTGVVNVGSWNHIAWVRSGTTITSYVNGAARGTATSSANFGTTQPFRVGANVTPGAYLNGYISNFRFVKGTAVYTGPFVPPAAPITAVTNTQLLLNATNAGIFDNTTVNDIETVGAAQISTSVVKYGTGSISFNGTTDYIISAPRSNVNNAFGTGNFTVELWVYPTAFASYKSIYGNSNGITATGWHCGLNASGNVFIYSNSAFKVTSSNTLTLNAWNNVAIVRNGSTVTIYIGGTSGGTWTLTTETFTDGYCFLGVTPGLTSEFYSGYMDDIRITKGYARYTANFTPPAAAFPNF